MRKRFIKWLIWRFIIKQDMTNFQKWIKVEFRGYHLGKNGTGRKKSVQKAAKEYYEKEAEREG